MAVPDAPFQGWCFDFESGRQLTATQLLQRMGADPPALEERFTAATPG